MVIKLEWRVVDIHSGVGVAGEDVGDAEIVRDGSMSITVVRDGDGVDGSEPTMIPVIIAC